MNDAGRFDRRHFLGGAALLGAGAAMVACTDDGAAPRERVTRVTDRADAGAARRVAVVGAGLAGLTAALDLRAAGWEVVVLEARDRVGGRVQTIRGADAGGPFSAGLHAEAGGESIDDNHHDLLTLLDRFSVPTERRRADREALGLIHRQGVSTPVGAYVAAQDGRVGEDYGRAYDELDRMAEAEEIDPEHPDRADHAEELDRRTLADFLDGLHLVPDARFVVDREMAAEYAADPADVSLLFVLAQTAVAADLPDSGVETMRISGGNDRLPVAMAAELGAAVATGAPVTSIRADGDVVWVATGDRRHPVAHVVLALPTPALARIDFGRTLPAGLRAVVDGLALGAGTKVITEYTSAFWRAEGWSGLSVSDAQYRISWDATDSYAADHGLLTAFTTGADGLEYSCLTDGERIRRAQAQIAEAAPGAAAALAGPAATIAWTNEPFTGGTYAVFRPGQLSTLWQPMPRRHRAPPPRRRAHRGPRRLHGERRAQRPPGGAHDRPAARLSHTDSRPTAPRGAAPTAGRPNLKGRPGCTDDRDVLRSTPSAPEVHARVTTLPEEYLVRRVGDHWAIVGPTGLFLVGKGEDQPEFAAGRTATAAHRLRNLLAEAVDVVPFVDPVLVTSEPESGHPCAMVELERLEGFLTSGPQVIPEGELQLLRHHLPAVITEIEIDGGLE